MTDKIPDTTFLPPGFRVDLTDAPIVKALNRIAAALEQRNAMLEKHRPKTAQEFLADERARRDRELAEIVEDMRKEPD